MSVCFALVAAQLVALSGGQLAGSPSKLSDDDDVRPAPAQQILPPIAVPPPSPELPPLPPPVTVKVVPLPKLDRVTTTEGKVHVGHIVGPIEHGLEFENERGERYPIALSAIVGVEHGDESWKLPVPEVAQIDPDGVRKELTLAFDVYAIERERAQLTYGEKALVCGLGLVATVIGFGVVKGTTGRAVGIVGVIGAGGGGLALGITGVRSLLLSRRADELRAELATYGKPPVTAVRGTTVELPAVAVAF